MIPLECIVSFVCLFYLLWFLIPWEIIAIDPLFILLNIIVSSVSSLHVFPEQFAVKTGRLGSGVLSLPLKSTNGRIGAEHLLSK